MTGISRRNLMTAAGSSAIACAAPLVASAQGLDPVVAAWTAAAGTIGACAIGRRCIELGLVEPRAADLAHLLEDGVARHVATVAGDRMAALHEVQRGEFRAGDVLRVGGWVLSRSEARFYALASIVAAA